VGMYERIVRSSNENMKILKKKVSMPGNYKLSLKTYLRSVH
jgi:hypothetical protein